MKDEILRLIADKLSDEIDNESNELLMNWVNESNQNRKTYNSYVKLIAEIKNLKRKDLVIDEKHHLSVVKNRILQRQKRRILVHRITYAAAAVLLPAIIFIAIFFSSKPTMVDTVAQVEEIYPGVKKAQLVLSTGERVELTDTVLNIADTQEGVTITNENSRLNYSTSEKTVQKVKYNTLIVGRGRRIPVGTGRWYKSLVEFRVYFKISDFIYRKE